MKVKCTSKKNNPNSCIFPILKFKITLIFKYALSTSLWFKKKMREKKTFSYADIRKEKETARNSQSKT